MGTAVSQLAISQPVVSWSIASLKHTFGVRLLDRSHGVERTIYGRTLLPHGLAAFNELRQGIDAIDSGRRNGASTSACSPTAAQERTWREVR